MSQETSEWLNSRTLVGFRETRGEAWHYNRALQIANGWEDNHYNGAIPVSAVMGRLFDFHAAEAAVINGNTLDVVEGSKLVYHSRTGQSFGIFSGTPNGDDGYKVHQFPDWLLDKVATLVDASAGTLAIGSAIMLANDSICAIQIERPDNVLIGGDALRPFICATSSHSGKYATSYKAGTTRVVCDNTLAAFHSEGPKAFKVKHTRNSADRMAEARAFLEISFAQQDAELIEIDRLMNTECVDAIFAKLVAQMVPMPTEEGRSKTMAATKVAKLNDLWRHDMRVAPYRGTAWGAVQAFNTYDAHHAIVRNADRGERNYLNFLSGKTGEADNLVVATIRELVAA